VSPRPAIGRRVGARTAAALAIGALSISVVGCGLVSDRGSRAVSVTITRDFGAHRLGMVKQAHVTGSEPLLHLLADNFPVQLAGNTVTAINGARATPGSSWSLFINGSATGIGSPKRRTVVHAGDKIWWDLHDDAATRSVPTVVGSFPEPFVHGVGGKRLPVTLECAPDVTTACDRVAAALGAVGLPAARQLLGTGSGTETLGIVVGTWREVSGQIAALLIAHGPATGGVYARFAGRDGQTLELLDARGRVVRQLGTWLVTGTNTAGVSAAASAVSAGRLRDHLAVAVQGTQVLAVPQP
jgi:hypothetical protein